MRYLLRTEVLKHGKETVAEQLTEQFNMIWQHLEVPEDWKKGVVIKLPKKGSFKDCNNWRGITLLSTPGKVFSRVLPNRLQVAVDCTRRDEQAEFRKGRSCTKQIFTLHNIIEQSLEHQQDLISNFIDFKKAFYSAHRSSLRKILTYYGIRDRFINIFQALYDNASSCCVKTASGYTKFFEIVSGVRQGCILSSFLFIIVTDFVMRRTTRMDKSEYGIVWKRLTDLDFADDIAIVAEEENVCQEMTTKLEELSAQVFKIDGRGTCPCFMETGHCYSRV